MFRPRTQSVRQTLPVRGRRGAILVVVLGLLTLFAILGISFVYLSTSEADAARIFKERENQNTLTPPDATVAVNQFLQSLIFPVGDSPTDALNSLRGHELLRSMYGGRGTNNVPYNGVGTFHEDMRGYGVPLFSPVAPSNYPNPGLDRAHAINFTSMIMGTNGVMPTPQPWQFLLDPEKVGVREVNGATGVMGPFQPNSRATVAKNAPYTYADLKDLYLASISPTTGEVLVKSFHRDWLFNAQNPNPNYRLAPWNPNDVPATPMINPNGTNTALNIDWVSAEGRLKLLRPRPVDQLLPGELPAGFYPLPSGPQLQAMPLAQQQTLYNLIRDRIQDGTILGYPQQNADGTFSGDHANMPGGNGMHKADSVLIDAGMQLIQLSNGKYVKPMVSAVITDLNGRGDLSTHGNLQYTPRVPPPGTAQPQHMSGQGLGRWEVNLERLMGQAEAREIVGARAGATAPVAATPPLTTRAGVLQRPFDGSGTRLTNYGPANWQVNAVATTPALPGTLPALPFHTSPTFVAPYEDNTTQPNHPSLFNPAEWGGSTLANSLKTFSLSNLRRMSMQFAPPILDYGNMTFPANTGLFPNQFGNSYRLSQSHAMLGMLTTKSTSLDRPGLMPNFPLLNSGSALQLQPGSLNPAYPVTFGSNVRYPDTTSVGGPPTGDFNNQAGGDVSWRNIRAVVGPVDLNRRLAEYRDSSVPAGPLSPGTVSPVSANIASIDRQNLARDIFIRLAIAAGGQIAVDNAGNSTVTAAPGTTEFDALRYLAQLAVNMVDYTDTDDVSTPFIWNPITGPLSVLTDPDPNPANPTGYSGILTAHLAPAQMGNRVVFGVEKPRLVINEAYSEVTNNPTDSMPVGMMAVTGAAHVKFWVELMNPTSTPYAAPPAGPLGDGSATLFYGAGHNPYRLVITRAQKGAINAADYLRNPATVTPGFAANVAGDLPTGFAPDAVFNFNSANIFGGGPARQTVPPNNGTYSGLPGGTPGVVVVGPNTPGMTNPVQFNPDVSAAPWNGMLLDDGIMAGPLPNTMGYEIPLRTAAGFEAAGSDLHRHVILLRRLANPYQPESLANPYITVDMIDHVPSHDAVHRASTMTTNRLPKLMPYTGAGYEIPTDRFAVGKISPYASHSQTAVAAGSPAYVPDLAQFNLGTFSTVLKQSPAPPSGSEPRHTFFRHNGTGAAAPAVTFAAPPTLTDTVMVPFDWYVHFDRPLVNQLELLHLQATKPYLVTQLAMQPPLAPAVTPDKSLGQVPWLTPGNGIFRALELLRVQDRTYGTPLGGKVHGKININTVMHPNVFQAWFDSQVGNTFSADEVYNSTMLVADPLRNDLWSRLIGGLTPQQGRRTTTQLRTLADGTTQVLVPVAGPSVHDIDPDAIPVANAPAILDRPYMSFGVAQAIPAPSPGVSFAAPSGMGPAGMGLQDTILRLDLSTNPPRPLIYPPLVAGTPDRHDYFKAEAARKVLNNLTTTSDTFAVTFTITFHEIRMNGATQLTDSFGRNLLSREIYKDIPGDMRQQFFTVIDRSTAATDLTGGTTTVSQPFFTTLETAFMPPAVPTVPPTPSVINIAGVDQSGAGTGPYVVYSDGQPVTLTPNGTVIVVGVGVNADLPQTVTNVVASGTPGVLTVALAGALTKPHGVGTCVSNANPGFSATPPTPPFSYPTTSDQRFQGVIPYVTRVR